MILRRIILILFLLAPALAAAAAETNYFCIICGKGPLTGRIWIYPQGAVCDRCYQTPYRCSLCDMPAPPGSGAIRTADGRLICKYDKTNVVLTAAAAQAIFAGTRQRLVGQFGSSFALKYPAVTVSLFDVDYWSERGRSNRLHKSGFSSTRKGASGECTHLVVLLSGRLREDVVATAAHEYTHLWINENWPEGKELDEDTMEGVCELAAYYLMGAEKRPDMQKRILESPYTHGKIKSLVALGQQRGMLYVLAQVKNGATTNLEPAAASASLVSTAPAANPLSNLPATLKFTGILASGTNRLATINGKVFAPGDRDFIRLRARTSMVICREIRADEVLVEVDGALKTLKLEAK